MNKPSSIILFEKQAEKTTNVSETKEWRVKSGTPFSMYNAAWQGKSFINQRVFKVSQSDWSDPICAV